MNRIKELRLKKGYTQKQMQALTGIDRNTYSRLENGKQILRTRHYIRIADALETSIDYLLGRTDNDKPYKRNNNLET